MKRKIKVFFLPWLMISCWANGTTEANVGQISYSQISVENSFFAGDLTFSHHYSENIENIILNLNRVGTLPYSGVFPVYLNGRFLIGCPRTNCSIFTMGFGYVTIPFIDGIQVASPVYTGTKLDNNRMEYAFEMTFNDPTLSTAESHVYRIEFWDCEWGQCELTDFDKKTVKRGEAIITVNYTP